MYKVKIVVLLVFSLIVNMLVQAQNKLQDTNEQVGFMRSEAKIYVVMVVVITILAGLLIYVARLDRKISKLEKSGEL